MHYYNTVGTKDEENGSIIVKAKGIKDAEKRLKKAAKRYPDFSYDVWDISIVDNSPMWGSVNEDCIPHIEAKHKTKYDYLGHGVYFFG